MTEANPVARIRSMSLMIEELVADLSYVNRSWLSCHPPKNALARPRYKTRDHQRWE